MLVLYAIFNPTIDFNMLQDISSSALQATVAIVAFLVVLKSSI